MFVFLSFCLLLLSFLLFHFFRNYFVTALLSKFIYFQTLLFRCKHVTHISFLHKTKHNTIYTHDKTNIFCFDDNTLLTYKARYNNNNVFFLNTKYRTQITDTLQYRNSYFFFFYFFFVIDWYKNKNKFTNLFTYKISVRRLSFVLSFSLLFFISVSFV